MEAERAYLLRRAEEERQAASEAADPKARKAHEMLAEQYEHRLNADSLSGSMIPTSAQEQARPSALN